MYREICKRIYIIIYIYYILEKFSFFWIPFFYQRNFLAHFSHIIHIYHISTYYISSYIRSPRVLLQVFARSIRLYTTGRCVILTRLRSHSLSFLYFFTQGTHYIQTAVQPKSARSILPVVPRKSAAEVSRIGTLWERCCCDACMAERLHWRIGRWLRLSVSLSLFICLPICLPISLTVYLSLSLSPSFSIDLYILLHIYLAIYLSVYLSAHLSMYLAATFLSVCLPACLSVCLSVFLSLCLSFYLPTFLSL